MKSKLLVLLVAVITVAAIAAFVVVKRSPRTLSLAAVEDNSSSQHSQQMGNTASEQRNSQSEVAQRTAPKATRGLQADYRRAPFLPTESTFLTEGALSATAMRQALEDESFELTMRRMWSEAAADPEAYEQTQAFKDRIQAQLEKVGGGQLSNISCGLSICMGMAHTKNNPASGGKWAEEFLDGSSLKVFAFTTKSVNIGNGVTQHRFVFSADPQKQKIRLPGKFPPAS